MKKILITGLLMIIASTLSAHEITCNVQVSLEEVASVNFTLDNNKQVKFASLEGYSFYLNDKGASKFELEVFDGNGPTRSYAEGFLKTKTDSLTWTLWTRDILLATTCRLAQ